MKLKPFGAGHMGQDNGIDLAFCVGWLESMRDQEGDTMTSLKGRKNKRLDLVEDAIDKLNQALDMEGG